MYVFNVSRFKDVYKSKDVVYADIAKAIGVSEGTIKSWTRSIEPRHPNNDNIKALAKFLQCKIEDIADVDNDLRNLMRVAATYHHAPIIGRASCGVPTTYYTEEYEETMPIPPKYSKKSFFVYADGDSMETGIKDGDLCLCDPEAEISNKDIVLFTWDGESGIKRYIKNGDTIVLRPDNPSYDDLFINDSYELHMVRVMFSIDEK